MADAPEVVKTRVGELFGSLATSYDSVIPYFTTFAHALVQEADLRPAERVLDLACGRGGCLFAAAEAVGLDGHVLGVDLASEMVEATAADIAARGTANADAQPGDAERLDLADALFDAVLCGFGVFFFPNPAAAFAEIGRVLRPGGRFVTSTFVDGIAGYDWADAVLTELGRPVIQTSSPVATASGLSAALTAAGFSDVASTRMEARFVFADVDAYLAWHWTTGRRRLMEALDRDHQLAPYREASHRRLRDHTVDGGFELVQSVDITVATRPS